MSARVVNDTVTGKFTNSFCIPIVPLPDGNGRVGRLAMNYFLVMHGHPPVTIHEEDRRGYYEALEAWDSVQNLEPLKVFLREQTAKTWRKQIEHSEKKKPWGTNTEKV